MSTENKLVDERPATLAEHIQLIKDTTKQAAIVPHAWLDEWLKEAERQEQTIADLRARVEALEHELERILEWHKHETIPLRERELKSIADLLATQTPPTNE